jgi:hypothetical protein
MSLKNNGYGFICFLQRNQAYSAFPGFGFRRCRPFPRSTASNNRGTSQLVYFRESETLQGELAEPPLQHLHENQIRQHGARARRNLARTFLVSKEGDTFPDARHRFPANA